jgi:hypothetical protein
MSAFLFWRVVMAIVKRKCEGCGKERKGHILKEYCMSCSQKKRYGTFGITKWYKECENCGKIRVYTWRKTYSTARKVCVSCSQIKNDEKYISDYRKYLGEVRMITERQPLESLPNIEKRGKSGRVGAYQIDHIISIKNGFDNNIPAAIIGDIANLQCITWEENRKKWK